MPRGKNKSSGKGWHGDSAGHARAAKQRGKSRGSTNYEETQMSGTRGGQVGQGSEDWYSGSEEQTTPAQGASQNPTSESDVTVFDIEDDLTE